MSQSTLPTPVASVAQIASTALAATPGRVVVRPRHKALRPLLRYASLVAIVALWQLATVRGWTSADTLPGPGTVARAAEELWRNGELPAALRVSVLRVALGAVIGILIGLSAGLVSGFSRTGETVIDAPLQALRAIPFTALAPLFILWLGIDETPKVAMVALAVALPIYINTFAGIRDVDRRYVEVAQVYRLNRRQIAVRVLLPGALPSLLVGLRFALTLGWIAVIVAEQLNASAGIGYLMTNARQFLRADVMLVCIVLYATLGLLTDLGVRRLERRLLVWRQGYLSS